ncbi:hypothetical protein AVEN_254365-1 [Araneus ventricosus]|uniref:Uncharacterized protein n=1 Tax=Araneus ventricosus TaxID=182803 RepID=A0A4Y2KFW1_ARAVE|nr:hypothetical protein AVEN_254365-1 [Araneus ventricosus]
MDIRYIVVPQTQTYRDLKGQLSAARIITGLRNSYLKDTALFEANLQPLSLRRIPNFVKYYNKLYSLDSRNRISAYLKIGVITKDSRGIALLAKESHTI